MRKQYFLGVCLAAMLGSTAARAQADFRPGYLVQPAGDTLRGQVQALGELRSTFECRFRPSAEAVPRSYAPASLRGYGITGEVAYVARAVAAADSAQAASAPQMLFLEVLASGPAQLYSCRDRPGHTRYFVAVGGSAAPVRELQQRRIKTFSNGFEAYETRALYRDTLAKVLTACPAVQVLLPTLPFQKSSLLHVVGRYNACVGGPVASANNPSRSAGQPVLSLVASYQAGTMRLGGGSFFDAAPLLRQSTVTGGLAVSLPAPFTRRTISLNIGALYAHELFEGTSQQALPTAAAPTIQTQTYSFNLQQLHVPIALRYTLKRSRTIRPFVEAGCLYTRTFGAKSGFTVASGSGTPVPLPFFTDDAINKNEFGLLASLGVSVPMLNERRLALLGRVATSSGLSNYVGTDASMTYFSALLSLDLTKP